MFNDNFVIAQVQFLQLVPAGEFELLDPLESIVAEIEHLNLRLATGDFKQPGEATVREGTSRINRLLVGSVENVANYENWH